MNKRLKRTAVRFLLFTAMPCLAGDPPGPLNDDYFYRAHQVMSPNSIREWEWDSVHLFPSPDGFEHPAQNWFVSPKGKFQPLASDPRYQLSGTAPFSWQWFFEGKKIPGATNDHLVIEHPGSRQAGRYSVVVTNAFGSSTNDNLFLTVVTSSTTISRNWWKTDDPKVTVKANIHASKDVHTSIQWFKNRILIDGETNQLLVVPFRFEERATYAIRVRASPNESGWSERTFDITQIGSIKRLDNLNLKLVVSPMNVASFPFDAHWVDGYWIEPEIDDGHRLQFEWSSDMKRWGIIGGVHYRYETGVPSRWAVSTYQFPRINRFFRAVPCCMPYPEGDF
jgi:hypothetical protein